MGVCRKVGLLIDLTNTWRYYERDEIDALGVEHLKVCTPGNPFVVLLEVCSGSGQMK